MNGETLKNENPEKQIDSSQVIERIQSSQL